MRPESASSLLMRAQHALQSGRPDEADGLLRRVLAAEPDNVDALSASAILAHQRGQPDAARAHLTAALARDGNNAHLHHLMGEFDAAAGRPDAAVSAFDRALALDPDLPDSLFSRGNALAELGRRDDAIDSYRRAIALAPGDAEAHLNLANVLSDQGRAQEARDHIESALKLRPDILAASVALAAHHLGAGDYTTAIDVYDTILARQPDLFEALLGRGRAALRAGDAEGALRDLEAAYRQRPAVMPLLLDLGETGLRLGRFDEAREYYEAALEIEPESMIARVRLGAALRECDHIDEANAILTEALSQEPDNAEANTQMGVVLQRSGDFTGALPYLHRAIEIDPGQVGPYSALVADRGHPVSAAIREEMESLVGDGELRRDDRAELHFALGQVYDAAADFDAAFTHFQAGNAIRSADVAFDSRQFGRFIDALCEVFTAAHFTSAPTSGNDSELPVLVVGMPRSGTTLVEQIIAAHPDAAGAGELAKLAEIAAELEGTEPYPLSIADIDRPALAAAAERYLDTLRAVAPDRRRVVDKMPSNFTHLGLFAQLLPRARIVHCRRNVMDTALSCYFHNFAVGVRFSYDLGKIGAYIRDYEKIMSHWREVLPMPVFDIRYEDLIADPEVQSRRLIKFVGLDWDDACLDFHKSERPVKTASLWQVRQPVYRSSIGRWRNYAKHLGPLRRALGEDQPRLDQTSPTAGRDT